MVVPEGKRSHTDGVIILKWFIKKIGRLREGVNWMYLVQDVWTGGDLF